MCPVLPRGLPDEHLWLVDSLVVPATLHDTDGRFLHVNEAAERASGFSNAEWLDCQLTDRVAPEEREKVSAHFRLAVETGKPADFETTFHDASGELRGARVHHLPLSVGGRIVAVLTLAFGAPTAGAPVRAGDQPRLTPRQREVLELVAAGLSAREIANRLTLSYDTVVNHLRGAFKRLDVHTRLEAIAAARRLGILASAPLEPRFPAPDDGSTAADESTP